MFPVLPMLLFAPLVLLSAAAVYALRPGGFPARRHALSEAAALVAVVVAGTAVLTLLAHGPATLGLPGAAWLSLRLDPVSATMMLLVAFVGWVVMRYSRTYLDGEPREAGFHALMLTTLAAVLFLVLSGSFAVLIAAFVLVGLSLRSLLLFYAERPEARRAAAKFTLVWGLGDATLIGAAGLFWLGFGSLDHFRVARDT